jgi:hypothetical protein
MGKDVSIEYAHIYTNQRISDEQKRSVEALGRLVEKLDSQNQSISLVVMVDDYSSPDPTFDYKAFEDWLEAEGYGPNLLIRESQLIPSCDEVLALVHDDKLRKQLTSYIRSKKYPCSLFIAAWYLLRLGRIQSSGVPDNFKAQRLINILPASFKSVEEKGLRIIGSTSHKDCVDLIQNQYLSRSLIPQAAHPSSLGFPATASE